MVILRVCEGSVYARLDLSGHASVLQPSDQARRHLAACRAQPGGAV